MMCWPWAAPRGLRRLARAGRPVIKERVGRSPGQTAGVVRVPLGARQPGHAAGLPTIVERASRRAREHSWPSVARRYLRLLRRAKVETRAVESLTRMRGGGGRWMRLPNTQPRS